MVVKVYGLVQSACTQRVIACLLEMGVDFELVHVDLDAGEHKRPEFLVRQYADRVPSLMGNNLEERAMVDQWLEVEAHNFNDLIFTLVLQLVILPRMGEPGDLALAHSCEQKLEKVLDVYEQRLSKCNYLAGDSFTLADLSHLPGIRYLMNEANMGHLITERKNVNAWWQDISNRPSWKKLMKLAGY
ncbi:glutathione s-transferase f11 [Quercus suber]|uniref:glutathione transferase n=1 Tax=Quercus suber TaxID=58331 RepID=A0AAW0K9S7_QUESU